MKFNELKTKKPAAAKRRGRGISAGGGKTAGRGTKGQGARKSGGVRPGFEGGQMPLYMRLPHLRGFKSRRPKAVTVYTGQLNDLKKSIIDNHTLHDAGLITSPYAKVKLLLNGELKIKKEVRLQAASRSAIEHLKKTGGSFEPSEQIKRPARKNQK